jgi:pimeloyl-ACP methyl ester carboxylesterase
MRPILRCFVLCSALASGACSGDKIDKSYFIRTSDGHHLHVTEQGQRESDTVVVVLHGGPLGESHPYNTGYWSSELEDRVRVVYFDQRGQGASQGPLDMDAYTPQRAADDVEEVVRFLEARDGERLKVYLFGHSWGGMLGVLALLNTDLDSRVEGWIEAAGCHDARLGLRAARDHIVQVGQEQVALGKHVDDWREVLAFAEPFDPDARNSYADLVELNHAGYRAENLIDEVEFDLSDGAWRLLRDAAARPARGSVARWSGVWAIQQLKYDIEALNLSDRMREISVPSLFLYGTYDFVCPHPLGEDAVGRIDNDDSAYVELTRSGHSLMFNEPELFTDEVVDFVERTGGL